MNICLWFRSLHVQDSCELNEYIFLWVESVHFCSSAKAGNIGLSSVFIHLLENIIEGEGSSLDWNCCAVLGTQWLYSMFTSVCFFQECHLPESLSLLPWNRKNCSQDRVVFGDHHELGWESDPLHPSILTIYFPFAMVLLMHLCLTLSFVKLSYAYLYLRLITLWLSPSLNPLQPREIHQRG